MNIITPEEYLRRRQEHIYEKMNSQQFKLTPDYKNMNIIDLMLNRHSVRLHNIDDNKKEEALKDITKSEKNIDYIDDSIYKKAFECCVKAPSACNRQPIYYFITRDVEPIMNFHEKHNYLHCNPSEIIICCYDMNAAFPFNDSEKFLLLDLGLSIENFLLALTHFGVSTCIYNCFKMDKSEELKKHYNIPDNLKIGCFIYCGKMNKYIQYLPSERLQKLNFV